MKKPHRLNGNLLTKVSDSEVKVNDKSIIRDMNGQWIASEELKPSEMLDAKGFIESTFGIRLEQ